ncbi:MAG: mechanosensitive ion channel domain-containing protein [Myxococcota bacterium]|nr:mechanosensitive ion channel domain-containing protein [Myxococcota bacterium]
MDSDFFSDLFGKFSELGEVAVLLAVAVVGYLITRFWIVGLIRRLVGRSKTTWDDALVRSQVFLRLAHLAPAMIAFYGITFIPELSPTLTQMIQRGSIAVMLIVTALSVGAVLTALNEIYSQEVDNRHRPIKGYLQVVKMVVYILAGISIISVLLDKSPWIFVSGIGAMSAVLLLIFKDTILSLVASIQITNNKMVHVGDWVEMPKYGADGDVIDVALHTVKIQNWDKTITTVPTHALITDSFKNWRGMSESGGRRIKRSIFIDVSTVRFLTDEEAERLGQWGLLRDYIASKSSEIKSYNAEAGRNPEFAADIRRLTNVGTLRAYIYAYLSAHPKIHEGMTLLVRQLQPSNNGLPIEIYCFTNDTDWGAYEEVQADLFDHILAIMREFDLRVFQDPTGADMAVLAARNDA